LKYDRHRLVLRVAFAAFLSVGGASDTTYRRLRMEKNADQKYRFVRLYGMGLFAHAKNFKLVTMVILKPWSLGKNGT
jgi:hypothetical protein